MTLTLADPTEWWLTLSPETQSTAWQHSQRHASPASGWAAYLNHLCLQGVLSWFQDQSVPVAVQFEAEAAASLWEFVSGVALTVGETRVVLLPSEAIDSSELLVPQEWIDIPNWAADYYLAVQVRVGDAGESWLRVWGYATHAELKQRQNYDPEDRTYGLAAEELTRDLTAFSLIRQLCPQEPTRSPLSPLSELSAAQAEQLIQRLGDAAIAVPRLAIPFAQWGALLQRPDWRQQLYHQRLGQEQRLPSLTQLGQWLQGQVEGGWRSLDALFSRELLPALRSAESDTLSQGKRLDLGVPVVLLLGVQPDSEGRVGVRVQLHPDEGTALVPSGITLALLSEAGEVLQSAQAQDQDNYIQLRRFRCPPGTRFALQVTLEDRQMIEEFIV